MCCFHNMLLILKDYFHIPLSEDEQGRRYLELTYAGAALKDSWSLADVGISFCSTLKCFVKVWWMNRVTFVQDVYLILNKFMDFPRGSDGKVSAYNAGDLGSIPGWGRSPGEGNGNPLQDSCLENPMDGGAWWATVHGVAKSRTRLSDFPFFPFLMDNSTKVIS